MIIIIMKADSLLGLCSILANLFLFAPNVFVVVWLKKLRYSDFFPPCFLFLEMSGKRNEVLVFFLFYNNNNKTPSNHSWSNLKRKAQSWIFVNEWAITICSGATVFHRMVLNVTFWTRKKKKKTHKHLFFCGK